MAETGREYGAGGPARERASVVGVPLPPRAGAVMIPEVHAEVHRRLEREQHAHPPRVVTLPLAGLYAGGDELEIRPRSAVVPHGDRHVTTVEVVELHASGLGLDAEHQGEFRPVGKREVHRTAFHAHRFGPPPRHELRLGEVCEDLRR
jgi:hypothetical protein